MRILKLFAIFAALPTILFFLVIPVKKSNIGVDIDCLAGSYRYQCFFIA